MFNRGIPVQIKISRHICHGICLYTTSILCSFAVPLRRSSKLPLSCFVKRPYFFASFGSLLLINAPFYSKDITDPQLLWRELKHLKLLQP